MPKDFPPFTTVQNRFYAWRDSGLWPQIISVFVMAAREAEGREPAPTAVVVDSRSVKTTEAGGPRGFDAGKKIKGRKRHVAVDTLGLPIECQVTAASVQDRDALAPLLGAVHRKSPWVTMSFVDGGYQGDEAQRAAFEASRISITVVKRTDKQGTGFIVLPKRWVVERTLGWINRARRLSKDFEATIESSLAWLQLASAYLARARAQNIRHAEIFFDPQAHTRRGVPLAAIVEGIGAALDEASRSNGPDHAPHRLLPARPRCRRRDKNLGFFAPVARTHCRRRTRFGGSEQPARKIRRDFLASPQARITPPANRTAALDAICLSPATALSIHVHELLQTFVLTDFDVRLMLRIVAFDRGRVGAAFVDCDPLGHAVLTDRLA